MTRSESPNPTGEDSNPTTATAGSPEAGSAPAGSTTVAAAAHQRKLRLDIEGLRAVAVGFVLIYHAGVPFIRGGFIGVDIFFVISGFLITGLLIRELEATGRISLARFYARRAKRLLPATGLVLIATTVLTWWSVSVIHWRTFGVDIISSAVYVVNWVLAGRSVDYLAEDVGASPVQHFWSLAVEEQFYIVWPLLLIVLAWWYRRRTGHLRGLLTVGIMLIVVPSFIWSVIYTASNPEQAFFVTTTRLWEMGIGAFVAIGAHQWERIPRVAAAVLGWAGLIAIVLAGILVTAQTPWPSYLALLPTLGTAAVIVSGFVTAPGSPVRLLSWRPAVWVGGLSYSLYLWHWPLLIAAQARWGDLTAFAGLAVVAASFIPAYLGYRFLENPIRFSPKLSKSNPLALSVGMNFSMIGVVAGLALILAVATTGAGAGTGGSGGGSAESEPAGAAAVPTGAETGLAETTPPSGPNDLGVVALGAVKPGSPGSVESLAGIDWYVPAVAEAREDLPPSYAEDCQVDKESVPVRCEYGDIGGDVTVAVVGDSKILQWESAFDAIGASHGIHFYSYTKSACAFSAGMQVKKARPYTSCAEWNDAVLTQIIDLKPDLVLTTSRIAEAVVDLADPTVKTREAMGEAITQRWTDVTDAGIPIIAMVDNPAPGISVLDCVAEARDLADCAFDRGEAIDRSSAQLFIDAAEQLPQVRLLDMRDLICPDVQCVPVIGNVLVYRATSHLTDTYIHTLTPAVEKRFLPLVNELAGVNLTP